MRTTESVFFFFKFLLLLVLLNTLGNSDFIEGEAYFVLLATNGNTVLEWRRYVVEEEKKTIVNKGTKKKFCGLIGNI